MNIDTLLLAAYGKLPSDELQQLPGPIIEKYLRLLTVLKEPNISVQNILEILKRFLNTEVSAVPSEVAVDVFINDKNITAAERTALFKKMKAPIKKALKKVEQFKSLRR